MRVRIEFDVEPEFVDAESASGMIDKAFMDVMNVVTQYGDNVRGEKRLPPEKKVVCPHCGSEKLFLLMNELSNGAYPLVRQWWEDLDDGRGVVWMEFSTRARYEDIASSEEVMLQCQECDKQFARPEWTEREWA